jgi:rhamnosyltransferase subunit B
MSTIKPPRLMTMENPKWIPKWVYRALFQLVEYKFGKEICPALNEFRKEIGLPPQNHVLQWVMSPEKIIGLFPPWYAPPQIDWPSQTELTGFLLFDEGKVNNAALPSELENFLNSGTPPIIFTPGTPNKKASSFFQAAVDATMKLGKRAILLTKYSEQIPSDLPPEIRFFEYLPFSQVFPRAALLVHHGGIGTLAQALKAGIPQLIVPWGLDQYDNASRIKSLGVGDELGKKNCTAAALAGKIDYLLNSQSILENCKHYADILSEINPIEDTCRIIEASNQKQR